MTHCLLSVSQSRWASSTIFSSRPSPFSNLRNCILTKEIFSWMTLSAMISPHPNLSIISVSFWSLEQPSCWAFLSHRHSDEAEQVWLWEYETDEGAHDLYMDQGEEIRFRVTDEVFVDTSPTGPAAAQSDTPAQPGQSTAPPPEESEKKEAPYTLIVRIYSTTNASYICSTDSHLVDSQSLFSNLPSYFLPFSNCFSDLSHQMVLEINPLFHLMYQVYFDLLQCFLAV